MDEKLLQTIACARELILQRQFSQCEQLLREALRDYPHAAAPHNLMGLLYEKVGDHLTAMKHFRAAWSLDPTYLPAIKNMDGFGESFEDARYIFDESDCLPPQPARARCG